MRKRRTDEKKSAIKTRVKTKIDWKTNKTARRNRIQQTRLSFKLHKKALIKEKWRREKEKTKNGKIASRNASSEKIEY